MNLQARLKEINDRLTEIRRQADEESDVAKLEALDSETDSLIAERSAIEKKLSLLGKAKVEPIVITDRQEEMINREERGKALKEGRAIKISTSDILVPTYQDKNVTPVPFKVVSDLVDLVHTVNLDGGETYQKPFVKDHPAGGLTPEGDPYTTAETTFGYATISKVKVTAYAEVSEEFEKLPAANYEKEVVKGVSVALKRKISQQIIAGTGTSNTFKGIFANGVEALADSNDLEISAIDNNTLRKIVFSYGGDEGVESDCVLILSKADLQAFAALTKANGEYLHRVNTKEKTIDDIPYVINSNCPALSNENTAANTLCMAYGRLEHYEVPIFSPVEVAKSTDYKFKEGCICYKASVFTGGNVVSYKGFLRVKKVAAPAAAAAGEGEDSGDGESLD